MASVKKKRLVLTLFGLVTFSSIILIYQGYVIENIKCWSYGSTIIDNCSPILVQNTIDELKKLLVDIKNGDMNDQTLSNKILIQKFKGMIDKLKGQKEKGAENEITQHQRREVCPEIFTGPGYGYPFPRTGWELTNCTDAKPLEDLVSIVINALNFQGSDQQLQTVLKGIRETYPNMSILIAINKDKQNLVSKDIDAFIFEKGNPATSWRGILLEIFTNGPNTDGKVWNNLFQNVKTRYVLVARDLFHFSWLAKIERQIRTISENPGVEVVGGSYRNLTAHWKAGCLKTTMKNYFLKYEEGYDYSKDDCLICDAVLGPFVTKTEFIKKVKLDENLESTVLFDDFFLRVREKSGAIVMVCPDSMYFMDDNNEMLKAHDRSLWLNFVKKWRLNKIFLEENVFSFTCNEIGQSCKDLIAITKNHLIPICCLEDYAKGIAFLHKFCVENGIQYEFDTGSVLGSVKVQNFMQWDSDGDINLLSKYYKVFEENKALFKEHGFPLVDFDSSGDGYFQVLTPEIDVEMWGMKNMSSLIYLPQELKNVSTLINIHGVWVNGPFSPGLYVRNRYGSKVYKHSQTWRVLGLESSWVKYNAGKFTNCRPDPNFHSCLSNFPGEGSFPFKVPKC